MFESVADSTGLRTLVVVIVVWTVWDGLGALAGATNRWSPAFAGAIGSVSLFLFLPVLITAVGRALRGRRRGWARFAAAWGAVLAVAVAAVAVTLVSPPGNPALGTAEAVAAVALPALAFWVTYRLWPGAPPAASWASLDADRFSALLEVGERPVAAIRVRVAGTRPLLLHLGVTTVAILWLLAVAAVQFGPGALVFGLGLVGLPLLGLLIAISNDIGERTARRGRRRSIARTYPRSDGGRGMWILVLTDRRLVLLHPVRRGRTHLVWHVARSEITSASAAGRSLRTLDPTIRLHFADGSSVRLTAPAAGPLLAAV